MWPAGEKPRFGGEGKERFCRASDKPSVSGNYFAR
jgi:hypothetical protein